MSAHSVGLQDTWHIGNSSFCRAIAGELSAQESSNESESRFAVLNKVQLTQQLHSHFRLSDSPDKQHNRCSHETLLGVRCDVWTATCVGCQGGKEGGEEG